MVKLSRFDIEFDNTESAYFAGQEVSGKVVIETSEPKKINEILLELKGRAKTYWTKYSGKSRMHCSQAEPYFCEQFNTCYTHQFTQTTSDNKKERILPHGRHEIPFSFTLPKTLPTSFEGDFGFIRYTCKAICERPWDVDIVSKRAFTVIGIEDINQDPEAMEPACETECISTVKLCCQKQGLIAVKMLIDRTGFTPGEKILVNTVITNDSTKMIRCLTLKMKQYVDYRAKTFSGNEEMKQVNRLIVKKEKGDIASHSTFAWTNEIIDVPPIPPRLSRCKIIQNSYMIELDVDGNATTVIPIRIGTIPCLAALFRRSLNGSGENDGNDDNDNENRINGDITVNDSTSIVPNNKAKIQVTITTENGQTLDNTSETDELSPDTELMLLSKKRVRIPSSILSELYPKLPNPYYRQSLFGEVDISEDQERVQYGDTKFAPKYPFYTD
uniref:Arrestin_C domain-containing protein n=1 Tax=Elaeophora elaphi TaxID=1147741 RepID=A0A0R3RJ69_9BILA